MKILRLTALTFILMFLSIACSLATGPSSLTSEIRPISINDKGEVLCRTRYQENGMGAHDLLPVEYGLCILSSDTILEFRTFYLKYWTEYPNMEAYLDLSSRYDSLFSTPFDEKFLSQEEREIAIKYNFKESNVQLYLKNDTLLLKEFEKLKDVDLFKLPQFALHGAKGCYSYDNGIHSNELLHWLYDFGNIIVLHSFINDTESVGATFDYVNPFMKEVDYEYQNITSVLFLNK